MARTYPGEVNVFNFDPPKEPTLTVAGLDSGRDWYCLRLSVSGDDWFGVDGYTFGVCQ